MDYFIRNATAGDVAAMIRLERESSTAAHWTDQQYRSLFVDDPSLPARLTLVASQDEKSAILGFLVARHISREWELENIVVAAEHQGKAIGFSLLAELLSRAQKNESHAVFLEVRESNRAARALYAKLGFEENGRRKGYYSNPLEDAVLYSKNVQHLPISG